MNLDNLGARTHDRARHTCGGERVSEELLIAYARKGAQLYAEQHPRPTQVTQVQAAEMLHVSPQTVSKMVRDGRLRLNRLGMISISQIDDALLVK